MCDRYTLTASFEILNKVFDLDLKEDFEPLYNAGPTQQLPVIKAISPQKADLVNWGLISNWSNNKNISPKLFNLSITSVLTKKMYQKGLLENRCLILASGFYLWKQVGKKQSVPYYFYFAGNKPFGIAGLWEDYEDIEGKSTQSFIMLTIPSTDDMAGYQDEIPMILKGKAINQWLDMETPIEELEKLSEHSGVEDLKSHAVSPLIGNLAKNEPGMIQPSVPSDQHGNYTLFN